MLLVSSELTKRGLQMALKMVFLCNEGYGSCYFRDGIYAGASAGQDYEQQAADSGKGTAGPSPYQSALKKINVTLPHYSFKLQSEIQDPLPDR